MLIKEIQKGLRLLYNIEAPFILVTGQCFKFQLQIIPGIIGKCPAIAIEIFFNSVLQGNTIIIRWVGIIVQRCFGIIQGQLRATYRIII